MTLSPRYILTLNIPRIKRMHKCTAQNYYGANDTFLIEISNILKFSEHLKIKRKHFLEMNIVRKGERSGAVV